MTKGRVSPELLKKIKDAVNILEVVGEHVVLRKSGSNYSGLCPFHSERTPSFSVSEGKQVFYCYGCQKGGDILTFLMELHGMSFQEAIEELADRAKIGLPGGLGDDGADGADPETLKRRAAARDKQHLLYKLNRFAAAYYHQQLALPAMKGATDYLKTRGVAAELSREFYLGAAHSSWDSLASYLAAKKAPLAVAAELGLIRPSQKNAPAGGVGYFDLFRGRVIFPILDSRGRVAGFGGRAMPGLDDGPKYLNSAESPIFQKGRLAYALYQAQKHIREKDEVILVEGYFDVLAMHAAGFQNTVATCGTALTPEHLALFRKFAARVTVLFDGDKAGVAATERAMELGLDHGAILYGAALPQNLDPDQVVLEQGRDVMATILASAKPLLDERIEAALNEAQLGPEARTQAIKRVGAWLGRYKDPVGREVRAQEIQKKFGITRALLGLAGGAPPRGTQESNSRQSPELARAQDRRPGNPASGKPVSMTKGEAVLLGAFARGGRELEIVRTAGSRLLPPEMTLADLFEYPPARALVTHIVSQTGSGSDSNEDIHPDLAPFMSADYDIQVRSILTKAALSETLQPGGDDVEVALSRRIARALERFSQRLRTALQEAEAKKDAGLHAKLSKEYLDVQRRMKEFTNFYDEG